MNLTMEYWINYECACGFERYGCIMDDPSCVKDTAKSELSIWRIDHGTIGKCQNVPFVATLRPVQYVEVDHEPRA
jgi:hypothetical protein